MVGLQFNTQYYEDRGGFKLLHLAAIGGYSDIVEKVLKYKEIDVNEKTKEGDSAIHLASLQDNSVVVDFLLKHNANIVDNNQDGLLPMHIAAANGNKSVLKIMFEKYIADKKEQKEKEISPFKRENVTKDMLELTDNSGKSVLHHASSNGHMDVIKLVFSYGKETFSLQDQDGR